MKYTLIEKKRVYVLLFAWTACTVYGHSQEADVACANRAKQLKKQTILQKSNLYEAPPKQELKPSITVFSALVNI